MNIKTVGLVILLVLIELATVTALKHWSTSKDHRFLIGGLLGYLLVGATFAYILHVHSQMTVVNSLWQVMNVLLVSAVGILVFKEKLTRVQMVGVLFALIATVLLAFD